MIRGALGLAGVGLLGWGGWLLLGDTDADTVRGVASWLLVALLAHDLVLAPLVLLVGRALERPRWVRGARRALRTGLLVAGCVTLVALPPLLRPGTPRNPTELPLDYPRNLLLVLGLVLVATVAVALTAASRTRATPER